MIATRNALARDGVSRPATRLSMARKSSVSVPGSSAPLGASLTRNATNAAPRITSGNGTEKTKLAIKENAVIATSSMRRSTLLASLHSAVITIASTAALTPKKVASTAMDS